jgi:hypothetical protein
LSQFFVSSDARSFLRALYLSLASCFTYFSVAMFITRLNRHKDSSIYWLRIFSVLLLTLSAEILSKAAAPAQVTPPRVYVGTRLTGPAPVIDGRLDDECWEKLGEWTGDFTQREPREGAKERCAPK